MTQQQNEPTIEDTIKDYEEYFEMFQTNGWIRFIKLQKEQLKNDKENAHRTHVSNDDWQNLRGHINLMERLIGFEDSVKLHYDALKEELSAPEDNDGDEF